MKDTHDILLPLGEAGITRRRGAGGTVFRRMWTGESQRGRTDGWPEDDVIRRGDILASPGAGLYAYVVPRKYSSALKTAHMRVAGTLVGHGFVDIGCFHRWPGLIVLLRVPIPFTRPGITRLGIRHRQENQKSNSSLTSLSSPVISMRINDSGMIPDPRN